MGLLKQIVRTTRKPGAARRREAVSYAAAGLWIIAAFILAAVLMGQVDLGGLELAAFPIGAVIVGAIGATVLSVAGELFGQHARDLEAAAIFEALRQGQTPKPYSLYLRPFASTNIIGRNVGLGMHAERIELEAQIERATRPLGRLVALGAPLEHIGAGRIGVGEEEWRDAIGLLLKQAKLVIMLPSSRAGTLEEIAMILKSDLIQRTVMLDPPNLNASKKYDHAAEWARVQAAFKAASFELPDEKSGGTLIFFGDRRKPLLKERLDIDADDRIERIFRRILRFVGTHRPAATARRT